MEEEIWKKHPDLTKYEFSNLGNLRNAKTKKELKKILNDDGYVRPNLYSDKFCRYKNIKVHRIVATLFIENVEGKTTVNHIDGVKTNNYFKNLEWMTRQENIAHAIQTGLRPRSWAQKLNEDNVKDIREKFNDTNISTKELAEQYNVTKDAIYNVLRYITYPNVDPEKKFYYKINSLQDNVLTFVIFPFWIVA